MCSIERLCELCHQKTFWILHFIERKYEREGNCSHKGHASITSTSRYLNTDLNYKRQILEQFGPPHYVVSSLETKSGSSPKQILDWLNDL